MKIVIMGQGYVGLPLAMAAAVAGHEVVGYEPDGDRVRSLQAGTSYIEDVHDAELRNHMRSGAYAATDSESHIAGFDIGIITVPTPLKDRMPDLGHVRNAATVLALNLDYGATVILESTTHPGTTRSEVVPILETASEMVAGEDFHVGFSPERIDPGNAEWGFENTPKIVSGLTPACRRKVEAFYQGVTKDVVLADSLEEAELAKVFENTFRHVNIALVNELSRMSHILGVDVWRTLELAGTKPFGFSKFLPGPGVGGHCLPVDPVYLSHHLKTSHGETFRLVELAQDINEAQPAYVVRRLQDALNERFGMPLKSSRILALGAAYKPDTGDMRESPAVEVIHRLRSKKARVDVVDPFLPVEEGGDRLEIPFREDDLLTAVEDYDAVVLLTPHTAFDLAKVAHEATFVLDTRGVMPGGDNIERL